MKKIPTLFVRDWEGDRSRVLNQITPGCEWVLAGEGVATIKWDGTACLVRAGTLFRRYDAKKGKTPPVGFEPAQPEPDEETGHWPGWLPVGDGPEDRYHKEAWANATIPLANGTFELMGPKVQGNPDGLTAHVLCRHGAHEIPGFPHDFEGIKTALAVMGIEGIVWHHPDGRMAKIKRRDFGLPWPLCRSA